MNKRRSGAREEDPNPKSKLFSCSERRVKCRNERILIVFPIFINFSANIFYLGLTLFVDGRGTLRRAQMDEKDRDTMHDA